MLRVGLTEPDSDEPNLGLRNWQPSFLPAGFLEAAPMLNIQSQRQRNPPGELRDQTRINRACFKNPFGAVIFWGLRG